MKKSFVLIFACGLLFGAGLAFSTMVRPEVVLDFLTFDDLGLALVMAAALAVALPIYQIAPRMMKMPPMGTQFERIPRKVAPATIIGGAIFGIGWGLSGVCPGAGVASLGVGNWPILFALAGMLIGAYVQGVAATDTPRKTSIATPTPSE